MLVMLKKLLEHHKIIKKKYLKKFYLQELTIMNNKPGSDKIERFFRLFQFTEIKCKDVQLGQDWLKLCNVCGIKYRLNIAMKKEDIKE
jgi:hypothetical protein